MRADFHMHGPIGFQPYWLKVQGYSGKNLAKEIVDTAIDRGISITAITSEEFEIPKYSIHDRFNYLVSEARNLPKEYVHDKIGENVLVVKGRFSKLVYIINSQTVIVNEKGKRLDHLVIGSNQVPNQKSLRETIAFCKDKGLIQIAEHPYCGNHFGIQEQRLLEHLEDYDAIEGHNSQMILPKSLSILPKFGKYNKGVNQQAQEFAEKHKKPWIATSDAHRIEDLGLSYIRFCGPIDFSSEQSILSNIKYLIKGQTYINEIDYERLPDWINWVSKFLIGTKLKKDKIS